MRNENLRQALELYCRDALTLLEESLAEGTDLPTSWREKVRETVTGAVGKYEEEIEWGALIAMKLDAIKATEGYGASLEAMREAPVVARHFKDPVGTPWSRGVVNAEMIAQALLGQVMRAQGGLAFQTDAFERVYGEIEDYLYRDALEYGLLAPLKGFKMEASVLDLGEKLRIKQMPARLKEQLRAVAGQFPYSYSQVYHATGFTTHALEIDAEVPKILNSDHEQEDEEDSALGDAKRTLREACSALRLYKAGAVGYEYVIAEPRTWTPFVGFSAWGPGLRCSRGDAYVLSGDEAEDFLKFWDTHSGRREFSADPKWADVRDIAVRRFNLGYERSRVEDKLIDYMVGFEALLLPGVKGEYGYRMSLRAAALLGEDPHRRAAVQKNVKKAYTVRSDIVHGSGKKHKTIKLHEAVGCGERRSLVDREVTLAEFVQVVESYLRTVINELGERRERKRLQHIMDDLDDEIVKGFSSVGDE